MTDIQKMIEEEAERKYLNLDDDDFLDFSDEEKLKAFKAGANFALSQLQHANRWRKVSEELPEDDKLVLIKINIAHLGDVIISGYVYKDNFGDIDFSTPVGCGVEIDATPSHWKPIE